MTGRAACRTCRDAGELPLEPARSYLRAERVATAAFRRAPAASLASFDGGAAAEGSHQLAHPPLLEPAGEPPDLPPVLSPGVLRAHGRHLTRLLPDPAGADGIHKALAQLLELPVPATGRAVTVVFPAGREPDLSLVRILLGSTKLSDVVAVGPRQVPWVLEQCREALALLGTRAPDLAAGFTELVAALVILVRPRTAGGSSSGALGTVWLSPRSAWPIATWIEIMVHEFVHQSLYLDELVHGLFALPASALDAEPNRVVSAVRKVPRSYDLSFHAAYVAYVQRRLYARLGVADPKPAGSLATTLDGLSQRADCLTDHGRLRLRELVDLDQQFPVG